MKRNKKRYYIYKMQEVLSIMVYVCAPCPWEVEPRRWGIQGHSWLHGKSEIILSFIDLVSDKTRHKRRI